MNPQPPSNPHHEPEHGDHDDTSYHDEPEPVPLDDIASPARKPAPRTGKRPVYKYTRRRSFEED